jgi:uncharacterized protein YeaC (DUF1315 family)
MSAESRRPRRAADSQRLQDFASAATNLDRPTYENLRRALEVGRWPDGRVLDARQREICLDAVLAWETAHLPPEQRTGYIERGECASDAEPSADRIRILGDE